MKPKRYIIEMCNDFIKRAEKAGEKGKQARLEEARNAYISGLLTETEVIAEVSFLAVFIR